MYVVCGYIWYVRVVCVVVALNPHAGASEKHRALPVCGLLT